MVGDHDRQAGPIARDGHVDGAVPLHRLGRVAIEIGKCAPQRIVVAKQRARAAVRMDVDANAVGDAGAAQLVQQLDEIDLALRPFGQPPEL